MSLLAQPPIEGVAWAPPAWPGRALDRPARLVQRLRRLEAV